MTDEEIRQAARAKLEGMTAEEQAEFWNALFGIKSVLVETWRLTIPLFTPIVVAVKDFTDKYGHLLDHAGAGTPFPDAMKGSPKPPAVHRDADGDFWFMWKGELFFVPQYEVSGNQILLNTNQAAETHGTWSENG
jgi:hypothetical protein